MTDATASRIGEPRRGRRWRDVLPAVAAAELHRLALWIPVLQGAGVWVYFSLATEPSAWPGAIAVILSLALIALGWQARASRIAGFAALSLTMGFALADLSVARLDAPVLPWPRQATVEGRVLEISRSNSGAPRVLLDRVTIYGTEPADTPARVRVTLLGAEPEQVSRPGEGLRVHAFLGPPSGPVEPGAFDFRLRAFSERIGAVGYARTPVLRVPAAAPDGIIDGARIWLARKRLLLSDALRSAIPGREGGFAAAIVTGDRSGIGEGDQEALRRSNLAHLLAISGLHMGILTGLVLTVARLALVFVPDVERRVSPRKVAAVLALTAGAAYLALSGATVATQRAFIMVSVALVAVMIDRPAISLRALAVAAALVLAVRPVSLLEVGFQMSFAATTALIAGYELARGRMPRRARDALWVVRIGRTVAIWALGVTFTSVLAGMATAPYAAFHFNRTAPYGLIANLAAVPAMGLVIAPSAIAAGMLAPFGWAGPALSVMGEGIGWVLDVAHRVAALPGAVRPVAAAPPVVLALITLGGLWLALWSTLLRMLGLAGVAAGLWLWGQPDPRPDLLVSDDARLVGLMTQAGRALDRGRGQSFAADTWLRRDGDAAEQEEAAARSGLVVGRGRVSADLPHGWRFELVKSKKPDAALLASLCRPHTLLVVRHGAGPDGPCRMIDGRTLNRMGGFAVALSPEEMRLSPALDAEIRRPWTGRPD